MTREKTVAQLAHAMQDAEHKQAARVEEVTSI
jgi:hypothetical protein